MLIQEVPNPEKSAFWIFILHFTTYNHYRGTFKVTKENLRRTNSDKKKRTWRAIGGSKLGFADSLWAKNAKLDES